MARDNGGKKARESVFYNAQHGPLPALFLSLTFITGVVDAVSILSLGRVFVANMTGNVVFVGLAAAGAQGFALGPSLVALAGFLLGAALGGWFSNRISDRGHLFRMACTSELLLIIVSLVIGLVMNHPTLGSGRYALSALLAIMMGIQNAVVRHLAVPDLTTTVLTMTLTGIAADIRRGKWWRAVQLRRRVLAVAAMLVGALVGGVLVIQRDATSAIALASFIMLLVTVGSIVASRKPADWRNYSLTK